MSPGPVDPGPGDMSFLIRVVPPSLVPLYAPAHHYVSFLSVCVVPRGDVGMKEGPARGPGGAFVGVQVARARGLCLGLRRRVLRRRGLRSLSLRPRRADAVAGEPQALRALQQAIAEGHAHRLGGKVLPPVGHVGVRGHDRRAGVEFVAIDDEAEEELHLLRCVRHVAKIVKQKEVDIADALVHPAEVEGAPLRVERVDEIRSVEGEDFEATLQSFDAERARKKRLSRTDAAGEDHVSVRMYELALRQVTHDAGLDAVFACNVEVEVIEPIGLTEPGGLRLRKLNTVL